VIKNGKKGRSEPRRRPSGPRDKLRDRGGVVKSSKGSEIQPVFQTATQEKKTNHLAESGERKEVGGILKTEEYRGGDAL